MAYARRMKVGVEDGCSYLLTLVENIKGEYSVKKTRFSHLKDDVIQLQYTVEKLCGTQRQGKENMQSCEAKKAMMVRIEDVKGRLLCMMADIRSLQTEESEEHRILQALVAQVNQWSWCKPMREADQSLVNSITDLRELHEGNCQAKNDLENIVNRAHHQLNKLEKVLTKRRPEPSAPPTEKLTEAPTDRLHRLVLRDHNSPHQGGTKYFTSHQNSPHYAGTK